MSKIVYIIFSISVCLSLSAFKPKCIIIQDSIPVRDTLKVDYKPIILPSSAFDGLILEYHNQHYSDAKKVYRMNSYFKTLRLNIVYNEGKINYGPSAKTHKTKAGLKILYRFTEKDTLAFDANFSTVKYYGEWYIIAFPKRSEWTDFTPPKDARGNFLYTPIAFHFDTTNLVLTRLKFNSRLNVPKHKKGQIQIYPTNKYGFQFDMQFAFSKKLHEFVFKASDK